MQRPGKDEIDDSLMGLCHLRKLLDAGCQPVEAPQIPLYSQNVTRSRAHIPE